MRPLRGHWPGTTVMAAGLREIATAPAILLIGGNPTEEHPLLAWTLRTNVRLNRARLYIANSKSIKLERQARAAQHLSEDGYPSLTSFLEMGNRSLARPCWPRTNAEQLWPDAPA